MWSIPLFDEWIDFEWFENNFDEKIFIYSDRDISEYNAQITKDNKIYLINNWSNTYDLKIKQRFKLRLNFKVFIN